MKDLHEHRIAILGTFVTVMALVLSALIISRREGGSFVIWAGVFVVLLSILWSITRPTRTLSLISLADIMADFDQNLTKFHRVQLWEKHKNKRVQWEGIVKEVYPVVKTKRFSKGTINLFFTPPSQSEEGGNYKGLPKIITAIFPRTAKSTLSALSKNDWVLIEGSINFSILDEEPRLVDAKLINFKKEQRED